MSDSASTGAPGAEQCPNGENCSCAIGTRHFWHVAFCEEREKLRALASSPAVPPETHTAGDVLIAAVDKWMPHASACAADDCDVCVTRINQLRLAYKVWQSSKHRAASQPPETPKTEEEKVINDE